MDTSWPENSTDVRSQVIRELLQGKNFAKELNEELVKKDNGDMVHAKELATKIMGSISQTLSVLTSGNPDNILGFPAKNSSTCDGLKSEDSGESSRSSTLTARRGCYKRRKGSDSWSKTTPTLTDDGNSWRKYGQKIILKAKYPRSYYRCTHKHDQHCKATKQVQQMDQEPPMYMITYSGHHTCKTFLRSPQMILDSNPDEDPFSSFTLNFESNGNPNKVTDQHQLNNVIEQPFLSSSTPLVKQEYNQSLSSSDYILSPEMMGFESCGMVQTISGPDYGDVISCTSSSHDNFNNLDFADFGDMQFEFCV